MNWAVEDRDWIMAGGQLDLSFAEIKIYPHATAVRYWWSIRLELCGNQKLPTRYSRPILGIQVGIDLEVIRHAIHETSRTVPHQIGERGQGHIFEWQRLRKSEWKGYQCHNWQKRTWCKSNKWLLTTRKLLDSETFIYFRVKRHLSSELASEMASLSLN